MEKFLFADGSNGFREVESRKELEELAAQYPDTSAIRIWIYGRNEWVSYASFRAKFPYSGKVTAREIASAAPVSETPPDRKSGRRRKTLLYLVLAVSIFLVFNFTKLRWEKQADVTIVATRPVNVPPMDVDSLIADIENTRGQRIDRNTKSNLRLRNTWPDAILLQVSATRSSAGNLYKFSNLQVKIDNTTGHQLDQSTVLITSWKGGAIADLDTVSFSNIGYNRSAERQLDGDIRADSITVAFRNMEARSFNFCYSSERDNPSGNYNDRWFCKSN